MDCTQDCILQYIPVQLFVYVNKSWFYLNMSKIIFLYLSYDICVFIAIQGYPQRTRQYFRQKLNSTFRLLFMYKSSRSSSLFLWVTLHTHVKFMIKRWREETMFEIKMFLSSCPRNLIFRQNFLLVNWKPTNLKIVKCFQSTFSNSL